MFLLAINGVVIKYPYAISELKKDNPQISFPDNLTSQRSLLAKFNVFEVRNVAKPTNVAFNFNIVESTPVRLNGIWYQKWELIKISADEEYKKIQKQWDTIRVQRTEYLYQTDWTQGTDVNLTDNQKQQWKSYRQSLRDITQQADPFNIIWPTPPVDKYVR